MFTYASNITAMQLGKLDGLIPLDKGEVFYVLGKTVSVGLLPDGALPLRSKPVGRYEVIDGKWVELK